MSDLISRQAAIEEWKNDFKGYVNALNIPRDDYNGIMAYIDELPPVQPELKWIPCSERPPEETGKYLVTANDGVANRVTYLHYHKRTKAWDLTGARSYWHIIAWMPLPEPYKEDNNG